MNRKIWFVALCVLWMLLSPREMKVYSQELPIQPPTEISTLTMSEGLSENTVWSICKDSNGFIWFGSESGLSRYDGQVFSNFSNDSINNKIQYIIEPSEHLLWFVSNGDFAAFNYEQECFLPINWAEGRSPFVSINCLISQNDTTAWLTQGGVLYCVHLEPVYNRGQLTAYNAAVRASYNQMNGRDEALIACHIDSEGQIAVVTRSGKLFLYSLDHFDAEAPKNELLLSDKPFRLINSFTKIADTYWLGTTRYGAFSVHVPSGKVHQYSYSEQPNSPLPHTDVYAITPLPNQSLFVATWSGYSLFIPDGKGSYETHVFDIDTDASLKDIEIRMLTAFCDAEGHLWAGTRGGGVLQFSFKERFYYPLFYQRHNVFCALVQDEAQYLWAATFHEGILRSTGPLGYQSSLDMQRWPLDVDHGICYSAVKDLDGSLWFGFEEGQLAHINPITGYTDCFYAQGLESTAIWCLCIDKEGRLVAGTSNGLYLINREARNATPLSVGPLIYALTITPENTYWLATVQGLYFFNPKTGFLKNGYEPIHLSNHSAREVFLSAQGDLYVGYETGLGVIKAGTDSLSAFYTTRHGLCNNFIECITQDKEGRIWLGSNSGVTGFNSEQQSFHNLYISGNLRSVLNLGDQIVWGTNKGIFSLYPFSDYFAYSINNKTYFTHLDVNNQPVVINEEVNGQVILTKGISFSEGIKLNPKNFRFSLMLNNMSYTKENQAYLYRLYPYEKAWRVATLGEKITYARLPHGKYVLEAHTLSPDGSYGPTTTLKVEILPKWTQTIWFVLGCILSTLLLLLGSLHRMGKIQAKKEQDMLLKQEMVHIRQEHLKEQQLHKERLDFFTYISHELRTPLSLIIAPVKDLMNTVEDKSLSEKLSLIDKNASLLSSNVDQMLLLQKMEAGMVHSVFEPFDMVELVRQVIASFLDLIRIKRLVLTQSFQEETISVVADQQQMASAIRNVLSNALKYTPDGGQIGVEVGKKSVMETACAQIIISDNGPGIPKASVNQIFNAFTTSSNEPTFSNKLGIGLKMVKNIMDLHHGTIDLSTEVGQGSTFTLSIPLSLEPSEKPLLERQQPLISGSGEPPTLNESPANRQRMLIVEDNLDMQSYLKGLFLPDYEVYQSFNGEDGAQQAADLMPDIILCDVEMPIMDGFACLNAIRSDVRTAIIPVIMLTARTEDRDALKGMNHGADDYLLKPFNPTLLKAKVQGLIKQRRQLELFYKRSLYKDPESTQDSPFLKDVIHYIEQHLSNSELCVGDIADIMHISTQTLFRKLKKETDLSASELIRSVRISKAASLLSQDHYSVQEVSEMVGYNDLPTFRNHFKKQFGVLPSQFKR